MTNSKYVRNNVPKWLLENEKYFLPPICNKMMHGDGQLKVFYVGGPNQRKDFHLEEGEELFYQIKGDMNLIIQEKGIIRDVHIKEGQVLLLPGKIPHSPQRFDNTVGLVIERERLHEERDCLRYFVGETTDILWETWFYCEDLGTQLPPVIKTYFESEQHKTGKPIPGTITDKPPFQPDQNRQIQEPFYLWDCIKSNRNEIDATGYKYLFDKCKYQSDIIVYGQGVGQEEKLEGAEVWLLQLEGESVIKIDGEKVTLKEQDSFLVRAGLPRKHERPAGSLCLSVTLNPGNKSRVFPLQ